MHAVTGVMHARAHGIRHLLRDVHHAPNTNRVVIAGNGLYSSELESLWPHALSKPLMAAEQVTFRLAPAADTPQASTVLQRFVRVVNARPTSPQTLPQSPLSRFEDGVLLPAMPRRPSPAITRILTAGAHVQRPSHHALSSAGAMQLKRSMQRMRSGSEGTSDDDDDDFMSAASFSLVQPVSTQHPPEADDAVSMGCFGRA